MSEVDVPDDSLEVVRQSVSKEKRIVQRKIERYEKRVEEFEEEFDMDSEEFVEKFESGELGDDQEWFEWKANIQALKRLKERKQKLEKAGIE
ncbi:MAG: hypothetical protein ABEJ95_07245 [Candidatus Nanohalobium sp.]